jgi:hypothetical protein
MDKIDETEQAVEKRTHPGKIDCSDIIEPTSKQILQEMPGDKNLGWMDVQLKPKLEDGKDFMIVDSNVCDAWVKLYGSASPSTGPVKRIGIKSGEEEDAETLIELYLKKITISVFPNKTLCKFVSAMSFYTSRA